MLPETLDPRYEKGIDGPIRQLAWQAMTCRWQGRFICPGHPQGMPEYPPYRYAFHGLSSMRHGMCTGIGLVCGGQANNGDRRPVSQPGKACVMQVEGGGRTCGVPPSIRWTGKSARAERKGWEKGAGKLTAHRGSGDSPAARRP